MEERLLIMPESRETNKMDADTIRNNTAFVLKLWFLALLLFIGSLFLFS